MLKKGNVLFTPLSESRNFKAINQDNPSEYCTVYFSTDSQGHKVVHLGTPYSSLVDTIAEQIIFYFGYSQMISIEFGTPELPELYEKRTIYGRNAEIFLANTKNILRDRIHFMKKLKEQQ